LRAALRVGDVVKALVEICSDLMGCEQLAIIEVKPDRKSVVFLGQVGMTAEMCATVRNNIGSICSVIERGRVYLDGDQARESECLRSLGIAALVPLCKDHHTKASLIMFGLLPQRAGLNSEDREVLKVLEAYAGQCLFGV